MRRLTAFLGLFCLLFLTTGMPRPAGGVRAGTAVRMTLEDMVHRADLIVETRVLDARGLEVAGRIETEYLLEVTRTFEGEDQTYRTVRMPGGVLEDGRGMVLAGMPRLSRGERTLLFLSSEGRTGIRVPVGLAQGKLSLVTAKTGQRFVVQNASDLALVDRDSGSVIHGTAANRILRYQDVVARIEAALAAERDR